MGDEFPVLGRGIAPGKVILFGEHSVVYGRPAIAAPVTRVWAEAIVTPGEPGVGITIHAPDLNRRFGLAQAPPDEPLAFVVRLTLEALDLSSPPDWTITIRSTIPIAAGMGSGTAVSAAMARAIAAAADRALPNPVLSDLVYQVERLHHGSPSGVDNTVVSYAAPVYFIRGQPPQLLRIARPFWLVIADTGVPSSTREAVMAVRRAWEADRVRFEALFDRIAAIVERARAAIEGGDVDALGPLMDENHALLREMGVSSPELERLVTAARAHGAAGAKLVGAGRGGNMIALVERERTNAVAEALRSAGATRCIITQVRQEAANAYE
ncbi:MAG TPA: mevalonate kinase [Caldilineae bacterium]|nr:mevalonate kinase [Caldilineae bacterium]